VTSPSRLLRIVSTDFLALRLFCFNIRQHGRQILFLKLHVDGRKFHIIEGRRLCTVGINVCFVSIVYSPVLGISKLTYV